MNNAGYASIRTTQRNYFSSRYIATGPEAGVAMPDFVEVARSFGLSAVAIKDVRELREGLARRTGAAAPGTHRRALALSDEALLPKVASNAAAGRLDGNHADRGHGAACCRSKPSGPRCGGLAPRVAQGRALGRARAR